MRARAIVLAIVLCAAACRERETPAPVLEAPVRVSEPDGDAGQSEPSIAVSADGRTLLAGWIDWSAAVPVVRFARSTDGGATFGASRRIDEADAAHPHGQAEPSLAFDGTRRFAFSWIGCRADADSLENHACDVYASISSDGGLSWSPRTAVAEGGHARRDRPWIVAEPGGRFAIAWSEVSPDGSRWVLAREGAAAAGRFALETVATLDGRGAVQPPSCGASGVEALLIDRTTRDPRLVMLEHRRIGESEPAARWSFAPEAVLLPYSIGAFAMRRDGEAWTAVPEGTGEENDFTLLHRRASAARFRAIRRVRAPGASRVALPWITPLGAERGFLLAWADETRGDGWRVRARVLGPDAAVSAAADVSRAAFTFQEASRTRNVGDFLSATSAGDAFWVAWSDTREGDADVWIVRGKVR